MSQVLVAWGLNGFLGVLGCYLVTCGVIGMMILPKKTISIKSNLSRVFLAAFGIILAFPVGISAYREVFYGAKTVIVAPEIKEMVVERPLASLYPYSTTPNLYIKDTASFNIGNTAKWTYLEYKAIESFGLTSNSSRCLLYYEFNNEVTVGMDDFYDAYILIGSLKQGLHVAAKGDYADFSYRGKGYCLVATEIYLAASGPSKIAFTVYIWA